MMAKDDQGHEKYRILVERIRDGRGVTSREQRAQAFRNAGLPAALQTLIDKVATTSTRVTDADVAAAKASGATEDQIFELVISAAVGQSFRMYETGLAALAEATTEGKAPRNAS
jgi:alkylhydroperoxidase/carboxymuconolactone decarboxylase family protein YurZ